jgi:preprotein translocase subunit SecD
MNISIQNRSVYPFIGWIIAAGLCLFYLFTWTDGKLHLRQNRIKFGIDLVGGTYITLSVQTDKAVETELFDKMQSLAKKLEDAKLSSPTSKTVKDNHIILTFESLQAANDASTIISSHDPALKIIIENSTLKATLKDAFIEKIKQWAVKGNIEVLRTRLDKLGVGEITIAAQGEKNIVIELPDVDPRLARKIIGTAALLEIKLVERIGTGEEEILEQYDGELPEGFEIVPGAEKGKGKLYYLVPKYADLTGRYLKDAYTGFGGRTASEIVVHFKFNPEGAEKFYELTRKNPNRYAAMILDGVVISAPQISMAIQGGEAYIHGNFSQESAAELATLLKSGAFVAPVTFEEERQIGPSLGQESINAGLMACIIGLLLLLIFGVILYRISGIFAFITLLYNLLFILIALAWLRATLTLPGIAGMVLTTGMAIDASILIFEKIREELKSGTTVRKAIEVGFSDAMIVILDSNITTFLIGMVLYRFGTGPVQGFAVTMMIGIIATLLTGLFFLRSLFNVVVNVFNLQKLSI